MMKRTKTLIEPRLQLRFAAGFACTAGLAALVQVMVLSHMLSGLAQQLPEGGELVRSRVPHMLGGSMGWTLLLLVPLSMSVGILMSFRIAGPLFRMKAFLRSVIAGEQPSDCEVRGRDELQELCALLNEATAPLRASRVEPSREIHDRAA